MFPETGFRTGALSLVLAFLLLSWPAAATHEADHRYAVQGYVLDEQRNPRPGVAVSLSMDNRSLGQGITDSRGYFSIEAHLHDADIGKMLALRAGNRRGEIRMQATRGDTSTRRVHHVNFIGDDLVEKKLGAGGLAWWLFAAGGAAILPAIGALVLRGRKKKARAEEAKRQKAESKKRKRSRKKKKR